MSDTDRQAPATSDLAADGHDATGARSPSPCAQGHAAAELDPNAEPVLEVDEPADVLPGEVLGLIRRTVGQVQAVDGVSFQVPKGGSLGLVGESGCGKSTTGRLITRLYDPTGGSIRFEGTGDRVAVERARCDPLRRDIQMIFQDPYTSLNPRHTVGSIVGTPLRVHNVVPKKQILARVQELLEVVGLNPEHYNRYPNEFSGGQRQRIGIARALALQPEADGGRRAGLGARRVDPGAGDQPAPGPAEASSTSRSSSSPTTSRWCATSAPRSR